MARGEKALTAEGQAIKSARRRTHNPIKTGLTAKPATDCLNRFATKFLENNPPRQMLRTPIWCSCGRWPLNSRRGEAGQPLRIHRMEAARPGQLRLCIRG